MTPDSPRALESSRSSMRYEFCCWQNIAAQYTDKQALNVKVKVKFSLCLTN
jgi:hypothetical protein